MKHGSQPPSDPLIAPCHGVKSAIPQLQEEKDAERGSGFGSKFWALVAKDIPRVQAKTTPRALEAFEDEWGKLRVKRAWLEDQVMKRWGVNRKATEVGVDANFGRLHDLCVEKHSELPDEADRKYKGRVVFGGNNITQQDGLQVLFNEGGSSDSFISAPKALDGVLLLPGCAGEQASGGIAHQLRASSRYL